MAGVGLDPDVCRAQAEVLEDQGAKIKKIESNIDGLIGELQGVWWGPDSKQFAQKWNGQHKADLTKAASELKKVATEVRKQVKEQETKSAH